MTDVDVYGGPGCVDVAGVRLLTSGVAAPGGMDAVSTDGFGARLHEASGEMAGLRTASILGDAVLAWRTPAMGPASGVACPGPVGLMDAFRTVHVSAEVGNETGDPGPLRYLDPSVPNVDKIGPDYEAVVQLRRRMRVSGRWRDFLPTDPAIAPRVFAAVDGRFPKRKGAALFAEAFLGDRFTVSADALGAEDLPFEPTLGREVPLRRQRVGVRIKNHGSFDSRWDGHVALRGEQLDRPTWSALASGIGPNWREVIAEAEASRYVKLSDSRQLWLRGALRQRLAAGPNLADGSVTWGEGHLSFFDIGKTDAEVRVSASGSGIGGDLRAGAQTWFYAPSLWLHSAEGRAHTYVSRTLPEAQPDLTFWVARGYSGLASARTPLALDGVPRAVERAGLSAEGTLSRSQESSPTVWKDVELSASGGIDASRGETVLLPRFTLAPEEVAVSGPVRAVAASGAVAVVEARAKWSRHIPLPEAEADVFIRATAWARASLPLAGDDAFRAARDREPTVRAGLSAEHSPDGLLRLDARLEWRAATRWDGWPEPDVPAALLLDLGLARTFADDRFEVRLTGRNVLGAPEQTHPLGATLDGRLFVRVEARF